MSSRMWVLLSWDGWSWPVFGISLEWTMSMMTGTGDPEGCLACGEGKDSSVEIKSNPVRLEEDRRMRRSNRMLGLWNRSSMYRMRQHQSSKAPSLFWYKAYTLIAYHTRRVSALLRVFIRSEQSWTLQRMLASLLRTYSSSFINFKVTSERFLGPGTAEGTPAEPPWSN